MTQRDVLFHVLDALEALDIPYMLVGSFASNYWGRPRTTHDADLLVDVPVAKASSLAAALEADFYAPDFAILEAVQRRDHFNAIHVDEAFKVDFWLRADTPYDRERFGRRRQGSLLGRTTWVCTAEDTILVKLLWARESAGVGHQLPDAVGVYEVQTGSLDETYLDRWAAVLGVADLLAEVRSRAALPPRQL